MLIYVYLFPCSPLCCNKTNGGEDITSPAGIFFPAKAQRFRMKRILRRKCSGDGIKERSGDRDWIIYLRKQAMISSREEAPVVECR
jgi:hypothetical protein